jgi:hypothetical protein
MLLGSTIALVSIIDLVFMVLLDLEVIVLVGLELSEEIV